MKKSYKILHNQYIYSNLQYLQYLFNIYTDAIDLYIME